MARYNVEIEYTLKKNFVVVADNKEEAGEIAVDLAWGEGFDDWDITEDYISVENCAGWDIVDFDGDPAFLCADDGGVWCGYNTREEAEYQLKCMQEYDITIPVNYGWHVVPFE